MRAPANGRCDRVLMNARSQPKEHRRTGHGDEGCEADGDGADFQCLRGCARGDDPWAGEANFLFVDGDTGAEQACDGNAGQ